MSNQPSSTQIRVRLLAAMLALAFGVGAIVIAVLEVKGVLG